MKFTKFSLLFLAIIACLTTAAVFNHPDGKLHVYFFNVGQGDAIFIKGIEGQKILIDGGPDNSVLSELGRRMNFYDHDIDLLVLTHPDSDHLTGLIDVLKRYKIKQVLVTGIMDNSPEYEAWEKLINEKHVPIKLAEKGETIEAGPETKLDVLNPSHYLVNQITEDTNDTSIVLKLSYKNISMLFTGDAEEKVGEDFLRGNFNIKANILKVSHHGSRNGLNNNKNVLEKIKPDLAIISVGKNRYGHPDGSVLGLLNEENIKNLRTDENGTIEVISDGQSYQIKE